MNTSNIRFAVSLAIVPLVGIAMSFAYLTVHGQEGFEITDELRERIIDINEPWYTIECPNDSSKTFTLNFGMSDEWPEGQFETVQDSACNMVTTTTQQIHDESAAPQTFDLTQDQRIRILQSYPNGTSIFSCPSDSSKNHTVPGDIKFTQESFTAMESVECGDTEKMNQTANEYKARGDEQVKILANALAQGGEDEFDKKLTEILKFDPPEGIRDALLSQAEEYNTGQGTTAQQ